MASGVREDYVLAYDKVGGLEQLAQHRNKWKTAVEEPTPPPVIEPGPPLHHCIVSMGRLGRKFTHQVHLH